MDCKDSIEGDNSLTREVCGEGGAVTWERRTQTTAEPGLCCDWILADALYPEDSEVVLVFVHLFVFYHHVQLWKGKDDLTKQATRGKMIRKNGNTVGGEKRLPRGSKNTGGRKGGDGLEREKEKKCSWNSVQNPNCEAG